nr:DNA replication licensing factor [Theileria orientalis]
MELSTEEAQSRVSNLLAHTRSLSTFLDQFTSPLDLADEENSYKPFGDKKYKNQLQEIKNSSSKVLKVYMDDVRQYFLKENNDKEFYEGLMMNTSRYLEMFYIAAEMVLETLDKQENHPKSGKYYDPIDELRESRMKQNKLPINLRTNYDILLINGQDDYIMKMKYVNADFVGSLVLIEVDVLRVANISPKLLIATYECDICHNHSYKTVEGNNYMPLMDCINCVATKNVKSTLKFHPKLSKFEKYQEIRVQEPLMHLNEGEIPKNLKCQLSNTLVGSLRPGDNVLLYGILLPVFKEGFVNNKFTLLSDKMFKVLNVQQLKKFKMYNHLNYQSQIEELNKDVNVYERLAYSIAPEIYGHQDVKKALLLQLVGGCGVVKGDGGFIRGNIHILLLGDPGVAKSQLMKRVCAISSRGIYTTGKGSSSSGLTAAIIKDPATVHDIGDTMLEGGALVLASGGVCCIDEFDKMDDEDRSAIYEVMEQQRVSVAKSGHVTTLKADSSVLAAANPLNGVYDVKKSVMVNLNLPAALLTRFDLQFLMLDEYDQNYDYQLSIHKLNNFLDPANAKRTNKKKDKKEGKDIDVVSVNVMRYYVNYCKRFRPVAKYKILEELTKWYVNNRQEEFQQELFKDDKLTYTTPRSILSILRLSQALARLRFSNVINMSDLEEAIRLTESMKTTLNSALQQQRFKRKTSSSSIIMQILKKMRNGLKNNINNWDGWINVYDLQQQVLSNGLKARDVDEFINKYSQLAIILLRNNNTQVSFPQDLQ